MEPRQDLYLPYLKPLLESPNSRYVLRDWHDKDQWPLQKYVEEGLLPSPAEWEKQEPKRSPVLVIANYAKMGRKGTSPENPSKVCSSHLKSIDLIHNVRTRTSFQTYGPTRVLMWMHDLEKRPLIPRTVAYRGKLAASLESAVQVEEIAGAVYAPNRARREDRLDAESSKIVAQRMAEDGTKIPPERQSEVATALSVSQTSRDWHQEFAELDAGLKGSKIPQFVGEPPGPFIPLRPGRRAERKVTTPQYKRYMELKRILGTQNKTLDKINKVLEKQEEIDKLDLAAHQSSTSIIEQERAFEAIDAKNKDLRDQLDEMTVKDFDALQFLDDDRKAFNQTPPLLSWDRRRAEPLIVRPKEFHSAKELALVDFRPLPPEEQLPMNTDQAFYFDILCKNLFAPRGGTTLRHLNHLALGAYEALVPKCPALTDPLKGGRRDVDSLRARNLTPEMLWQLAMAWDEWPFKPTISELVTQFGVNFVEDLNLRRSVA